MIDSEIKIILGNSHKDERGTVFFVNDFDMTAVRRLYYIEHVDVNFIRAWRGHKIEQRWFQVVNGSFCIKFVKIDNWNTPNRNSKIITFVITEDDNKILHMPSGYASGIQALEKNSKVIVFSDYGIDHAANDNYLYSYDYFGKW